VAVRILRITAQNVWRLEQMERSPNPTPYTLEAESFLFEGRALHHLRRAGTIMLAADAGTLVGVGIAYPDPTYTGTIRIGSLAVDHRHRREGIGFQLFDALVTSSLLSAPYAIWLVHAANEPMLELSRRHARVTDEAPTHDGYVQFFAE
jgi:GNAT superfamily N-acetyltransferase